MNLKDKRTQVFIYDTYLTNSTRKIKVKF